MEETGPGPFVTRRHDPSGRDPTIWRARDHRKGLIPREVRAKRPLLTRLRACLWMPRHLNWRIGIGFAIGSALFMLGCILSLTAPAGLTDTQINSVYFAGSIFFTTAAGLQLFQAANAGKAKPDRLFGWAPKNIGWLSSALQFPGTLLFNVNTWNGITGGGSWLRQDLIIWGPDLIGSVLFLASGQLAFMEVCHRWLAFKPANLDWWIGAVNLAGCIAFMISAICAFVLPAGALPLSDTLSVIWTLIGAACFLCGALLLLIESAETGSALSSLADAGAA